MSRLPAPITPVRTSNVTRSVGEQVASGLASVAISEHLNRLTTAAQTLNALSDQLTKEVANIEAELNKFNLGIWAFVNVVTLNRSDDGTYEHGLQLIYGKASGKWGFIIGEFFEHTNDPEQNSKETWPFKEAPREFRIKVVDKIPALLATLVKRSGEVASEITEKVKLAHELALTVMLSSPSGQTK